MPGLHDSARVTSSLFPPAIHAWADEVVSTLMRCGEASSVISHSVPREVALPDSLVDRRRQWTPFALQVLDLIQHEAWVEGEETEQLLNEYPEAASGALLDVGCSTGRALRKLVSARRRAGVDIDELAIQLGRRLAQRDRMDIELFCASAHELPFESKSFDAVLFRNAITYMNQRKAIAEVCRVLRPGGVLILRFENFRYDIQQLALSISAKQLACRLRDCFWGVLQALLAVQPPARRPWAPGRVYGSTFRLRRFLLAHQCDIEQCFDSRRCPRFLGRSNQTTLAARKRASAE